MNLRIVAKSKGNPSEPNHSIQLFNWAWQKNLKVFHQFDKQQLILSFVTELFGAE